MENVNETVVTEEVKTEEKPKKKLTRKKIIALVGGILAVAGAVTAKIIKGKHDEDVPVDTEVYDTTGETIVSEQ